MTCSARLQSGLFVLARGSARLGHAARLGCLLLVYAGFAACTQPSDFRALSREHESAECKEYCERVTGTCREQNAQYLTVEACLALCERLDFSVESDAGTSDALACRLAQARLAKSTGEPGSYCDQAGPGGGHSCGGECQNYCQLLADICPQDYAMVDDCPAECAKLASRGTFEVLQDQQGNTVQCRLAHLTSATLDAPMHCPHARFASTAYCTP
jgi:hypothetical protein